MPVYWNANEDEQNKEPRINVGGVSWNAKSSTDFQNSISKLEIHKLKIFVIDLDRNLLTFDVKSNDTVLYIKYLIEKETKIFIDDQRLYSGDLLLEENDKKLKDYSIKDKFTLYLKTLYLK